ncbi:hypothetical protein ACOMHN_035426 [Nucella lapillus]
MLLFQRLVKIAANTPDCLEDAFAFEMSNIPTSLFDSDGLPRQPKKASLASYIWTATQQASAELPDNKVHVIDGGYLLHLLSWARGCTYNAIAQSYIDFVKRMFGKGIVVFDGYSSNPSTKDIAHLRRKQRTKVASDFVFDGETLLSVPKENFLANENNKGRFISLLSSHLLNNGFDTIHASADADCRIVHTTLETAKQHNVVLIGEDTYLLILLLHHCTPDHHPVFFTSTKSSSVKVWDIQAVQSVLGEDVCKHILFAHAIGGCDTVSARPSPPTISCTSDFIPENTTLTCTCNANNIGQPEGRLRWYTGTGSDFSTEVVSANYDVTTLEMTQAMTRGDDGSKFRCVNNWTEKVNAARDYTARVAWGPDTVSIEGNTTFYTDTTESKVMTLTCRANEVNPPSALTYSWNVLCDDKQQSTCTFRPRPGPNGDDNTVINCTVTNSKNKNKQGQKSVTLDIKYTYLP